MEDLRIKIQGNDSKNRECHLALSVGNTCQITVIDPVRGTQAFIGTDLFECLKEWRKEYEKFGELILCCGARVDVYVSRMQRQMGRGRRAYVLHLGKQGATEDTVDIFDDASAEKIVTVEKQKMFFDDWIKSL